MSKEVRGSRQGRAISATRACTKLWSRAASERNAAKSCPLGILDVSFGVESPDLGRRPREPADEAPALIFSHAEDSFRLLDEFGRELPSEVLMRDDA